MIFKLFSVRQREEAAAKPDDVYQYDVVPPQLLVQTQQILVDAIGPQFFPSQWDRSRPAQNSAGWMEIHRTLCREFGMHSLTRDKLEKDQVINFLDGDTERFVDCVELCLFYISNIMAPLADYELARLGVSVEPLKCIDELNYRFLKAGFGFQFENDRMFRVDSAHTHVEIIKPAISFLNRKGFEGPRQEFFEAFTLYRRGDYENSIILAAKSLESALKCVCEAKRWQFEKGARSADLLRIVRKNKLWPDYLDGSFDQLIATLSSGLPKIRNDTAAHGQGPSQRNTPDYVARYALNLAASKLILIGDALGGS